MSAAVKTLSAPAGPRGRVLILAGSDSGGGAGVQADIKTVTAFGGFAATAITALTAQNTLGVRRVLLVAPDMIIAQAQAVLEDIGADVIKTGMLGSAAAVEAAADLIAAYGAPAVVDPVCSAKDGSQLLDPEALEIVLGRLAPLAALLTPNAPEAALLTRSTVSSEADLRRAGHRLLDQGASAVLMKGGHLEGSEVVDLLITPRQEIRLAAPRLQTTSTHGTGCTLASACAVGLALGRDLETAVRAARDYVRGAILNAPGLGSGHGPMDHAWLWRSPS
jgi:hydroxymethylpyrimidine/phosphomethylpyrimidine kinase